MPRDYFCRSLVKVFTKSAVVGGPGEKGFGRDEGDRGRMTMGADAEHWLR